MHLAKIVAASALALGMEMSAFITVQQPPTTPPATTPPRDPIHPQPPATAPGQGPTPSLPGPNLPTRGNDPNKTNPSSTNPNTNPNNTTPAANPNGVVLKDGSGTSSRANRPFAFQSPQVEARFNESSRRLAQMEQRQDQANQDLLRRLGEARQLTGDRQNAALMDLLQNLLQNNAEMQRYMVQSRLAWTGGSDEADASDPANGQPQNVISSNQQQNPNPANSQPRTAPPVTPLPR